MKKSFFVISVILLSAIALHAQERWVALYANAHWAKRTGFDSDLTAENYLLTRTRVEAAFLPEIALNFVRDNRDFLEIGISGRFRRENDQNQALIFHPQNTATSVNVGDVRLWELLLQGSYNYHFREGARKRYNIFLGYTGTLFTQSFAYDPAANTSFYAQEVSRTGLYAGVVPRIRFNLTDRLRLDFNTVVSLLSATYEKSTSERPGLSESQNENSLMEIGFLSSFQVRAGLCYNLNRPAPPPAPAPKRRK
jgi:hypothetical protein